MPGLSSSSPPCSGSFRRIYNLRTRTRSKSQIASPPRRSFRRIYNRRACSSARAAAPFSREKRRLPSYEDRSPPPSRRAKRHVSATESDDIFGGDGLLFCSSKIPAIWGAKGPRIALSGTQIPISEPKRARPLLPVDSIWRDWTDLSEGPAGLIAERLLASDIADYVSFRAVCRSWRSCCSTDPRKHGILDRRFHPRHWIMLRESSESGGTSYRHQFMNTSTGYCRYLDLPELHGHDLFPTTEGLLVLLDRATSVVRLLNPFTRQAAELPPASTLLAQRELKLGLPIIDLLEVSGAGLADETSIAIHFRRILTVAVVKPGDAHWTVVAHDTNIRPAMSFAGRFYCATQYDIMVVETSTDHPPRLSVVAELAKPLSAMMMDTVHLVDNEGELMLVDRRQIRNVSKYNGNNGMEYNIYRVDLDARKIVPVRGLGGRAMFIGLKLALSVSPSVFPSISADAIYLGYENLLTGWLDNSPIHLMDGTSEPRELDLDDSSSYGPLGVDDHLSWFVAGYHD